eukprot:Hpha_TRINITY_DN15804_c1_g2::TRINITY_DN15804_c1_g2_i1::g.190014::m.190014
MAGSAGAIAAVIHGKRVSGYRQHSTGEPGQPTTFGVELQELRDHGHKGERHADPIGEGEEQVKDEVRDDIGVIDRKVMLCLDEHDDRADAAVSYASYLVLPSLLSNRHRSTRIRNLVKVFGHVHLDSRVPFAGKLVKVLGGEHVSREERSSRLRQHCHTVAASFAKHLTQLATNVELSVEVDASESNQLESYQKVAASWQPNYILFNEREDRGGSGVFSLFGTESWQLLHMLSNFTVIVAKDNIEGIDPAELGVVTDVAQRAKRRSSRRLAPEQGRGMYVLLMIDPELNEASVRAVKCACDMLKPEDRLLVYSCWNLPDFATAMYANDARWDTQLRQAESSARQQAQGVASSVAATAGLSPEVVRVMVEQQAPGKGAEKLLSAGTFHMVICGGKRHDDPSARGVMRGWMGHYRRRMFGTVADHLISRSAAPAVAVCY